MTDAADAGEDATIWALYQPDFIGTMRQLTCCGKCGEQMQSGHNKPRRAFGLFKPNMHWLCDACYDSLPD